MRAMTTWRPLLGAGFLVTMFLLAAPPMAIADAESVTHVHIQNIAFNPETVTILLGETVEWDNHDAVPHTVTANNLLFDSGNLFNGDSFSFTFTAPGVFGYHCQVHNGQTGTVVVVDPSDLPDLVITGLLDDDTIPGVQKEILVAIRNIGGSPAGPSTTAVTYVYDGAEHFIGDIAVPTLAPGETHTGSVQWLTLGKVGDFVVMAHADANDEVMESNEENNTGSATFSVLVSGIDGIDPLAPLPGP